MARVHYVKKAQQRYGTKPVIDPATGEPKTVTLHRRGTDIPLTNKAGRPRVQVVTERDLTKPLPMPKCDHCGKEIEPGQSYRWVKLRFGKRFRHAEHPSWQPWDLSSSMANRILQVTSGVELPDSFDDASDIQGILEGVADEIDGFAEERRESAQNIVDGFGHETEMSYQLEEHADGLEAWAEELRSWEPSEEAPDPDEDRFQDSDCGTCGGSGSVDSDCEDCGGSGFIDDDEGGESDCETCGGEGTVEETCGDCDGDGTIEAEEDYQDALSEWQETIRGEAEDVLQNVPDVG